MRRPPVQFFLIKRRGLLLSHMMQPLLRALAFLVRVVRKRASTHRNSKNWTLDLAHTVTVLRIVLDPRDAVRVTARVTAPIRDRRDACVHAIVSDEEESNHQQTSGYQKCRPSHQTILCSASHNSIRRETRRKKNDACLTCVDFGCCSTPRPARAAVYVSFPVLFRCFPFDRFTPPSFVILSLFLPSQSHTYRGCSASSGAHVVAVGPASSVEKHPPVATAPAQPQATPKAAAAPATTTHLEFDKCVSAFATNAKPTQ